MIVTLNQIQIVIIQIVPDTTPSILRTPLILQDTSGDFRASPKPQALRKLTDSRHRGVQGLQLLVAYRIKRSGIYTQLLTKLLTNTKTTGIPEKHVKIKFSPEATQNKNKKWRRRLRDAAGKKLKIIMNERETILLTGPMSHSTPTGGLLTIPPSLLLV